MEALLDRQPNGGRLFKWNGIDGWSEMAQGIKDASEINSLAVVGGSIFGGVTAKEMSVDLHKALGSMFDKTPDDCPKPELKASSRWSCRGCQQLDTCKPKS